MAKGFDDKKRSPGSLKPTYRPSGRGTYNCRWRKEERRAAAVSRQKALCENGWPLTDKKPMDWRMMLPASEREENQ